MGKMNIITKKLFAVTHRQYYNDLLTQVQVNHFIIVLTMCY